MNNYTYINPDRPVVLVGIVSALCIFGDSMLYVVLPIFWKEVGLTALWQVGILLSINRFVRLPLNPFLGWLYNRISLRAGLILGVILGAVSTAGYGIGKGFVIWIILRAVWGTAWSLMRIGAYLTVINCANGSNSGRLMGKYNGLWKFGSLIGVLCGGVLTPIAGIETVSVSFGLLALLGLLPIAFQYSSTELTPSVQSSAINKLSETKWTKPVLKVIVCGLALSFLQAVFGSTLTLVIDSNYSNAVAVFGILLTSTALGGILQAVRCAWEPFLATWFGHKSDGHRGRIPLLLMALTGAAAGYALIPWHVPVYAWILIVLMVMVTITCMSTLMDAMASDVARTSSVIAVMTAYSVSTDLGSALGPTLTYWLIGAKQGLLSIYLFSALIFILIALWYRQEGRRQAKTVVYSVKRRSS